MTDYYKAGKYWPETNEIVNTYEGGSMQVISMNPDDMYEDESPSSHTKDTFVYEGIYDGNYLCGDDTEFIFEEADGHEDSSSSSTMDEHPYNGAHTFADQLELLLTNVDGDSDPDDVITIPSTTAAGRQCRRVYRKSMSLPMSPIGGARERLDSLNLSDILLGSPLKMGGMIDHIDVDPVDQYEDLSLRNDFNLINFVGQDLSPVKEQKPKLPVEKCVEKQQKSQKEEQVVVVKEEPPEVAVVNKSLSKGKCLELLRATHERQENLVKRCVAIENQKRSVTKNLFKSVSVPATSATNKSDGIVSARGRPPIRVSRKNNTDDDPNWSPTRDMDAPTSKKSAKTVALKRDKSSSSCSSSATNSQSANKANLVSGNSNLNDIKKKALANLPMIAKSSNAASKTPAKVLRTDIPIVPITDHEYCSPVQRSVPIWRSNKNRTKTAILIDDVPPVVKAKKEKVSPKKPVVQNPPQQIPRPPVLPEKVKPQNSPATVLPEKVKSEDPLVTVVVEKRKTINLEDYKKMRNTETTIGVVKVNAVPEKSVVSVPKDYVDPISEAQNKALRLQERRKAARMKQDEIQLPTTPLMPILPLAIMAGLTTDDNVDMMGDCPKGGQYVDDKSVHFDEIQIVSVGCNTQVTILPSYESIVGNISQSSSYLLSNLSSRAKNPITSNSLLFSIQDVVIKKSVPQNFIIQKSPNSGVPASSQYSPGKPEGASVGVPNDHTGYHHGEDKVIMHLRKDRIRPKTSSFGCQTDLTPEFPQLKLLAPKNKRHYRRRSTSASSTGSSSSSDSDSRSEASSSRSSRYSDRDESEDEFGRCAKRRRLYSNKSWSRSRSRSRSHSSYTRGRRSRSPSGYKRRSRERSAHRYRTRSRSPRRSYRESRSRSRSRSGSRRPMFRNNKNNNKNRWMTRNRSPVEERRIVYVGRLEKDLTKEGLRRKFNGYGTIKLVTMHEKSNGTRYGFVTFEEATDAFRAIETAKEDSIINMYDVGFGGRRAFCGSSYADLDNVETEEDIYGMAPVAAINPAKQEEESFESLLQSFKKKVMAIGP